MSRLVSIRSQLIRTLGTGIGKSHVVYVSAFLAAIAMAQMTLGMVFFARELHQATPTLVGLLAGVWSTCYIVGCLLVRPRFAALLPRVQISVAMVLASGFSLLIQWAPDFRWLLILTGITGMSLSMFWPPLMGWISTGSEGEALGKLIGRFNLAWSTGIILGPYICGWLGQHTPRASIYLASALFFAVFLVVTVATLTMPHVRNDSAGTIGTDTVETDSSTPLRFPAWFGLVVSFITAGVLLTVFPLSGQTDLGLSTRLIGAAFLVRGLMNTATFLALGKTRFWHFCVWPMSTGLVVIALIFVGLAFTTRFALILPLLAVFGVAGSLSYAQSIFHGASGARDRSTRMAVHEALLSVGLSIGAVAGGMVYERAGMRTVYLMCAFLALAAVPAQALIARACTRPKNTGAHP